MKEGGCDCGPTCTLSKEVLDARVKDVLRVKARLGLIKNPSATFVQVSAKKKVFALQFSCKRV